MAGVKIEHVTKVYKPGTPPASRDISVEINDGEFFILLGPSGCGKSTLLRMIAGLERTTEGRIVIGDKVVDAPASNTYVEPKNRDIAMVFQSYALYPHMTVYQNMAFGLTMRRTAKDEIDRRVKDAAQKLGLADFLDRLPKALSGGQRQRVALGRALVREPQVFLLDEPLSNLDAKLRGTMRVELKKLQASLATTMIYVTHDQTEAMTLGDRIAVFKLGELQQVGAPLDIYKNPVNRFVAGFLGSPPMNFLRGKLNDDASLLKLNSEQSTVLPESLRPLIKGRDEVEIGVRPEDFTIGKSNEGSIKAEVEVVEALGDHTDLHVRLVGDKDAALLVARVEGSLPIPKRGDFVALLPREGSMRAFDLQSGLSLTAGSAS